jgi:hypothetical protein
MNGDLHGQHAERPRQSAADSQITGFVTVLQPTTGIHL